MREKYLFKTIIFVVSNEKYLKMFKTFIFLICKTN